MESIDLYRYGFVSMKKKGNWLSLIDLLNWYFLEKGSFQLKNDNNFIDNFFFILDFINCLTLSIFVYCYVCELM